MPEHDSDPRTDGGTATDYPEITGEKHQALPNPSRGCGHLKKGKAYIRGLSGRGVGILPPFVRCDPPIPYREIGTNGSFTRGYQEIDGLTMQINLEQNGVCEFTPLAPIDYEIAIERMVTYGMYPLENEVPDSETQRHIDRVGMRDVGGDDWGRMNATEQTDLLMRAGESYYPDPEDFIEECVQHGLSKAIPVSKRQKPPEVFEGVTRCWILHPNALPDTEYGGAIIGYAYINDVVFTEPDEGSIPAYIEEYEDQNRLRTAPIAPPEDDDEDDDQAAVADFSEGDDE